MPVLHADALSADPQGLEFLRDVLGTHGEAALPERRFPLEAWTPKPPAVKALVAASAEPAETRSAEAVL